MVAACAEAGTHYCDLTGEVLFMRDSIDRYDDIARASGARIVHSCGFDSIPSDLGVLALQLAATADDPKAELGDTRLVVTGAKGGVSGGTIASGLGELERAGSDATAARVLADPIRCRRTAGRSRRRAMPPTRRARCTTTWSEPGWLRS